MILWFHYFDKVALPSLHITLGIFHKIFNLFERSCKQLGYQLVHFLSHGEDQFDEISMQIKRIVSIEDFIHQLETGKENCTESYHWKMIQLDDDDEDGRCNLQHMYEDHISKLEKERIR